MSKSTMTPPRSKMMFLILFIVNDCQYVVRYLEFDVDAGIGESIDALGVFVIVRTRVAGQDLKK